MSMHLRIKLPNHATDLLSCTMTERHPTLEPRHTCWSESIEWNSSPRKHNEVLDFTTTSRRMSRNRDGKYFFKAACCSQQFLSATNAHSRKFFASSRRCDEISYVKIYPSEAAKRLWKWAKVNDTSGCRSIFPILWAFQLDRRTFRWEHKNCRNSNPSKMRETLSMSSSQLKLNGLGRLWAFFFDFFFASCFVFLFSMWPAFFHRCLCAFTLIFSLTLLFAQRRRPVEHMFTSISDDDINFFPLLRLSLSLLLPSSFSFQHTLL